MTSDEYIHIRAKFLELDLRKNALSSIIEKVSRELTEDEPNLMITDTSLGMPPETMLSKKAVKIMANQWPTPQQIMELLRDRHYHHQRLNEAWRQLPAHLQESLQPPPYWRPAIRKAR